MTLTLSNGLKTAALTGALSLIALAGTISTASAHYMTTRCQGDFCQVIRCDDDGDDCYRIRSFYRDDYYERRHWRRHAHRWDCDRDGDDCRRVYRHHRPDFGWRFGWRD